jgi:two-component system, NtrC family, response regulator HydG
VPLSPRLQAELLRVLQEGEVRRLGDGRARKVSVRVISSSKRSLPELVRAGTMREDLGFRLNVLTLQLPPLRDRREDIPALVRHFLAWHGAGRKGLPPLELSPATWRALASHAWPGNVRQLENEVKRLLAVHEEARPVEPTDLAPNLRGESDAPAEGDVLAPGGTLDDAIEALERRMLKEALDRARGNRSRAARALGLSRSSLHVKMAKYGLK